MSPNELAAKLLSFRSTTCFMMPGQLVSEIGPEAMQDALGRGWIVPDTETGFLALTSQGTQIQEMRDLAATLPVAVKPPETPTSESRMATMRHATRLQEYSSLGFSGATMGAGAPGSGQPERAPSTATPPAPTAPTTPTTPASGGEYMVGEDVVVAEEGKFYQAKVSSKNPDGTYKLSFGPNKPAQENKAFRKEELQKIAPNDPSGTQVRVQ